MKKDVEGFEKLNKKNIKNSQKFLDSKLCLAKLIK